MLAGIINAPNAYNPFNNLELATERRNQVLYLMNYHGYISDDEYKLAKNIKVEDLLVDYSKNNSSGSVSHIKLILMQLFLKYMNLLARIRILKVCVSTLA